VVSFCGRRIKPMWEVKSQRGIAVSCSGYSENAQRKGTPSYLEPNSDSLQKPIEGGLVLAVSATNSMLKNRENGKKGKNGLRLPFLLQVLRYL